jgi:hypothetical protein
MGKGGECAYRNEPYGSIKCGVYFPELRDYQFFVEESVLRSNIGACKWERLSIQSQIVH